jgi:hypothetical protein
MQTIRMGSHIRILRVLEGAFKAGIATSGAIANIIHITTTPMHCNDLLRVRFESFSGQLCCLADVRFGS